MVSIVPGPFNFRGFLEDISRLPLEGMPMRVRIRRVTVADLCDRQGYNSPDAEEYLRKAEEYLRKLDELAAFLRTGSIPEGLTPEERGDYWKLSQRIAEESDADTRHKACA